MTSRVPTTRPLHERLARHHRAVQRALVVRHALRAAALSILFIAAAAAAGMLLPVAPGTAWARLIVVLAASIAATVYAVKAFLRSAPAFDAFLETVEERFPKVRSWLRNGLDFERESPSHGSVELARAVSNQTAERLATVPIETLTPRIEARRPTFLMLGALALIVIMAVASPIRLQRSWTTLWNPALAAPPVTLSVEPGDVEVTPGAALAVRARVWGSGSQPSLARQEARGDEATLEGVDEDGARVWRFDLSQLTREQRYHVSVSHVQSPEYTITMAGEPQPLSFTFEYRAPSYARLPVQRGASTRGDLAALAGSEAQIEVTFDRDLESVDATLGSGNVQPWTAVTPRRWSGTIPVRTDGTYELHAQAPSGEGRFAYRVSALDDAPPILTVITPEGDMDLPTGQQIPTEIVGQDDLGLAELRLQYRKDPSADWTTKTLSRFSEEPREARVSSRWDASQLALLPGETATFRFELYDGNSVTGRGRAVSPTFELRFPSMAELYENLEERQESVQESLEDVAERANELQESLEKLARQPQASRPQSQPSFERAEEMRKALERQQELSKQIDDATEQLRESLEDAAEREAFDEELQRRMRELNALMEQIQSKELREAMERMQQALENMDQSTLERNLPNWQKQNEEMLAHLDRSIELLKKLREEERLQSLVKRAEELKEQQDQLNKEHAGDEQSKEGESGENEKSGEEGEQSDESQDSEESNESGSEKSESEKLAERQEQAAERTEQLAEDMQEMGESMSEESEKQQMQDMAEKVEEQAAKQQRQAAEQSRQQQSNKAEQSGKRASQELGDAAMQMQQMMKQRQDEREGIDLATLRRSAKDLVSLQRSAEENVEALHDLPGRADRQTDLAEGVARVSDSLYTLAERTPFITQELAKSLGRAMLDLENSGRELGQGNRRNGENLGRQGAQSLTEAILELRKSEDAMCNNPGSGGGQSKTTAERLGAVGEQQSRVNGETRSLAQRLSEQMKMSAGDQAEMERIADQQAQIRRRLEEIEKDDEEEQNLLGKLDAAKREMEEVEEALRQGTTPNDLEQKQQRILSRLLDAQRSVHRRDYDPEREAQRAEDVLRPSPPELPEDLLKQSDRLRLDMLKAEADRYPVQYRAFIEAYLRSLNGTRQ